MRISTLIKIIQAPQPFLYSFFSQRHMVMPRPFSALLSIGNRPALLGVVPLSTYDGSGQACHPTLSVFQGKIYMACTPYPYRIEAYENPCLYVKESGRWKAVSGVYPLVKPQQLGFEHYSDPCLFQWKDTLVLLFRKRERRPSGTVEILYTVSSPNGTDWESPRFLAQGPEDDRLISPAAAAGALFFVECYGNASQIVRYALNGLDGLEEKSVCGVSGLDPDFFVWHIDCAARSDGTVRGLFMLQKKHTSGIISKLALFLWEPGENLWRWERDLPQTEEERKQILFVYKSCFTENPDRVLCSACDRRGRFFLYEKSI